MMNTAFRPGSTKAKLLDRLERSKTRHLMPVLARFQRDPGYRSALKPEWATRGPAPSGNVVGPYLRSLRVAVPHRTALESREALRLLRPLPSDLPGLSSRHPRGSRRSAKEVLPATGLVEDANLPPIRRRLTHGRARYNRP